MENPNLFLVCLNAFAAVLGLLWVLALALRGLIELFPEKSPAQTAQTGALSDAAFAVAIAAAAHAIAPGARVTRIEEIR